MPENQPHLSRVFSIEEDWIDYNGHLNMAYYNLLFDQASDETFAKLGMGPDYAQARRLTTYAAEIHICYVRELRLTDTVQGRLQLIDHDEKRLHTYQELCHAEEGWVAATSEVLTLHIDMTGPKVTPFPKDIIERIAALRTSHASLPSPANLGRAISLRKVR